MCYEYLPLEMSKDVGMYIQWSHIPRYQLNNILGIQISRKPEIISEVDVLQALVMQLSETA